MPKRVINETGTRYRIEHEGAYLCTVRIVEKTTTNEGAITVVRVESYISYQLYGVECTSNPGFYTVCALEDHSLYINDFGLPPQMQHKGIGHFIWHKFYEILNGYFPEKVIVSGKLSFVDERGNNAFYRNRLWRDLIGFGKVEGAIFELYEDSDIGGCFEGLIQDPWDPALSKLDIVEVH